jgi:EAL domain-containing protein (putative c-di-GMP-specific phosphodiesterase class I)
MGLGFEVRTQSGEAEALSSGKRQTKWCLETTVDGGKSLSRVPIRTNPFRVGREEGLELTLPDSSVSKQHAEIVTEESGNALLLHDLGSTNGTFVNRERIASARVQVGDIIHFASFEFRVGHDDAETAPRPYDPERGTLALEKIELPQQFVPGTRELTELIEGCLAEALFQPICVVPSGEVVGFEVLGRGLHSALPAAPQELFRIAETVGKEAALSRVLRSRSVTRIVESGRLLPTLFLNTHPTELGGSELVESLRQLRERLPRQEVALELHEGALADPRTIAHLKRQLDELEIGLAYDDFGVGERLLELAEVPPDYLKFDRRFVMGLDRASESKKRLLAMLVAAAREIGATAIAEGVETEAECEACRQVGFTLVQGYLYGPPLPIEGLGPTPPA